MEYHPLPSEKRKPFVTRVYVLRSCSKSCTLPPRLLRVPDSSRHCWGSCGAAGGRWLCARSMAAGARQCCLPCFPFSRQHQRCSGESRKKFIEHVSTFNISPMLVGVTVWCGTVGFRWLLSYGLLSSIAVSEFTKVPSAIPPRPTAGDKNCDQSRAGTRQQTAVVSARR